MDTIAFLQAQIAQATSRADLRQKVADVVNALNAFLAALDAQLDQAPELFAAQNPNYFEFVEALPIPSLDTLVDTLTAPPGNLTYASNPAIYILGTDIPVNTPTSTGGAVVSYSVAPELPAGLTFNTATGAISGIPTVVSAATDYTVTAVNSGGSASVNLNITVNDAPPSGGGA